MKISLLMRDSSEKDGNIETVLDYILSWTLKLKAALAVSPPPKTV